MIRACASTFTRERYDTLAKRILNYAVVLITACPMAIYLGLLTPFESKSVFKISLLPCFHPVYSNAVCLQSLRGTPIFRLPEIPDHASLGTTR